MVYLGFKFTCDATGGDTYRLCEVCRQCYEANRYPCLSDRFPQGCHDARVPLPSPPSNAYDVDTPDSELLLYGESVKEEEDNKEEVVVGGMLQQGTEQRELNDEDIDGMSDEY